MKTEIETLFTPIKVTLTLETRVEAEALYNIINHWDISHASGLNFDKLRAALRQYKSSESFDKFCQYLKERT